MAKGERCAAPEVFGPLAAFMHGKAVFKVIGDAGIKRIVGAAEDVDSPGHEDDFILFLMIVIPSVAEVSA